MALKILKKAEKVEAPRLPEGGDRFVWTELPESVKPVKKIEYAQILKGTKDQT